MTKKRQCIILALVLALAIGLFGYFVSSENPTLVAKKIKLVFWLDGDDCFKGKKDSCFFSSGFLDTRGKGGVCLVDQVEYFTNGEDYTCRCTGSGGAGPVGYPMPMGWDCFRRIK